MRNYMYWVLAIFSLTACSGGGDDGRSTPSPIPTVGKNPATFLQANLPPSAFTTGGPTDWITPITQQNAPTGTTQLSGIVAFDQENQKSVSGDAELDVNFDASTLSGKAEHFAVYGIAGTGTSMVATRERPVNGQLSLTGTLTQQSTSLMANMAVSGTLTDTDQTSTAVKLGAVSGAMPGIIGRNAHTGNKLVGTFVSAPATDAGDSGSGSIKITAPDGTVVNQPNVVMVVTE